MKFSGSAPVGRNPRAVLAAVRDPAGLLAAVGATGRTGTATGEDVAAGTGEPAGFGGAVGTDPTARTGAVPAATRGAAPAQATITWRIGSITATHDVQFTPVGDDARTVTYRVRGREVAGQGDVDGLVGLRVAEGETGPDSSVLELDADLDVRGRIARFGADPLRAAVADAVGRLAAALATGLPVGVGAGAGVGVAGARAAAGDVETPSGDGAPVAPVTAAHAGPQAAHRGAAPQPLAQPGRPPARVLLAIAAAAAAIVVIIRTRRKAGDGDAVRHH
jgi:carbon monoxide dehydrogenase subunit G